MIDRSIHKYSNVKLLDIIKNSINKSAIKKAEKILESRELTLKQKNELEIEYLKYKELKEKRKNEPLTLEEWLTFFILPFFTPKPRWRDDDFSESESERFKKYGYDRKAKESEKVKIFGIIFWLLMIIVVGVIFNYFRG